MRRIATTRILVPSLVTFVSLGGSLLGAAIAAFSGLPRARAIAAAAAGALLAWLTTELSLRGYLSGLQLGSAAVGSFAFLLRKGPSKGPLDPPRTSAVGQSPPALTRLLRKP